MNKLLNIIFENDFFIILNKPSGLFSVPDRFGKETSLKAILEEKFGKIYIVHRLDKDTSGIIVFAKDEVTHRYFSMMFENREVQKYYYGLVKGTLFSKAGSIEAAIMMHAYKLGEMVTHQKGKPSLTSYTVEKEFKQYSWLKFQLHTGRTHQIRVHCKHIGNPIVCDEMYGDGKPVLVSELKKKFNLAKKEEEEKPILGRLALHAYQLNFNWDNKDFEFIAEIPKDMRATLQQLEKNQ